LQNFKRRFDVMTASELMRWKTWWMERAQGLAPKNRKQTMKCVLKIEKAIRQRTEAASAMADAKAKK
jgi:hypothetical protein